MSADHPETPAEARSFAELGLNRLLLEALAEVGYETPSPIQAATIPPLLAGRDVLGQAQTGTGKTAAFALPILQRLELERGGPQALVLAPTRELALQVAEAFQRYAAHLPGFRVLPIYGGQGYGPQLAGLRRGAHVVVGTPGRVIDHLERGVLDLSHLTTLVLDEADEMLRMGFIDDVEKVFAKAPPTRQIALFSATMPAPIRRIAREHQREPVEIAIKAATTTAANIRQRYWYVSGLHKLDALTRILEVEPFEAMLVFARTKQMTEELADKLQARGFNAAAINGDLAQQQRERLIQQLRDGKLDILVATDVAARGLDVERVSHVLNYDIPHDAEAYVHRIGRTGRAGRAGEAIVFVAPREKRMLLAIEHATRQRIEEMRAPSVEAVNDRRVARFRERIDEALGREDLGFYRQLIEEMEQERNVPAVEIAAALARLLQGDKPLLLETPAHRPPARETRPQRPEHFERGAQAARAPRHAGDDAPRRPRHDAERARPASEAPTPAPPRVERWTADAARPPRAPRHAGDDAPRRPRRDAERSHAAGTPEFETFRIEVGHAHGVAPGNIVGAIANEAGLDSKYIGRVVIHDDHSLVDLPAGMPREIFGHLKKVWVSGQQLRISRAGDETKQRARATPRKTPKRGR